MFWNKKKNPPQLRSEPRDHHYVFAHQTVREVCANDPLKFFAILASADRAQFIAWLWHMAEKRVGKPLSDVDPSKLVVTTCRVKDSPTAILKMPTAVGPAEAHFVGVLLTNFQQSADAANEVTFRYFTLEHGMNLDGTVRTVMCEWAKGSHLNFGDGPPATVEAFVEAIERIISPPGA